MFDIGFWEIALIGVIALLVIGPERLPGAARTAGLYVGRIRRYVAHVRSDIERELHADELRQIVNNPEQQLGGLHDIVEETKDTLTGVKRSFDEVEDAAASRSANESLSVADGNASTAVATESGQEQTLSDDASPYPATDAHLPTALDASTTEEHQLSTPSAAVDPPPSETAADEDGSVAAGTAGEDPTVTAESAATVTASDQPDVGSEHERRSQQA